MTEGAGQAEPNGTNGNGYSPLPTGPLTDQELQALRRILRDEDRANFFWREVRRWVGYGGAVIGVVYMSWDIIIKTISALVQAVTRGTP